MTLEGSLPYSIHNLSYWAFSKGVHDHCSASVYNCAPNCVNNVHEYFRDSVNQISSFPLRNHSYNTAYDIIKSYEDL
jgi:hypothetical protein